jgi:uncharacterized membrane protein YfcA
VNFAIVTDPWFWALAIPAVTLTGISKGGLGGAGGVSTPLVALAIPPAQGAAIMLPVLCVMDIAGIQAYLGRWDKRIMRIIVPAGLLGCLVGTFTFRELNDNWIRILLGLIALGFLAYNFLPRAAPQRRPSDTEGWFWSTLAGFTSFVSHTGSPPLLVYLLPQKLDKAVFVSTLLVFFAAMNYAKIVPYWWLGLLDFRNLATSLLLVPIGIAGTYLGVWLQTRINALWFYRIVHALLFFTGAKLLYDGITRL